MEWVVPDYYSAFHCIADKCRHNCCIGWEIDIDEQAAARYTAVSGAFGRRLRENISLEGTPHFVLGEHERCPFLNERNLCDIICEMGEEALCAICADHPRFRNELPGRVETGLGLCCEEAARLIVSQRAPVALCVTGEREAEDATVALRDRAIALLQERERTIAQREEALLSLCGAAPLPDVVRWIPFFLSLERLDGQWTTLLCRLRDTVADTDGFERYMIARQTEYEQLLVYFVYRHLANAADAASLAARGAFAVLACRLLRALGAMLWSTSGTFSVEQQAELARMFSAEIEYSDENLYAVLDALEELR